MGNVNTKNICTDEEKSELSDDKHDYPFENLVFNGGGAKCIGQVGTLKVFEELGILQRITRFAGTSGGSITATLAALGYTANEIEHIMMKMNLERLAIGQRCGCCSYIQYFCNFLNHFGLHPANLFTDWLGNTIHQKMGDSDATFVQLYNKTGKELAITATDVTRQNGAIFHVKTTPDMSIKMAVRMSVSIPGYFTPSAGYLLMVGFFVTIHSWCMTVGSYP
ncbi:uncharacterized protein YqhO-like [Amphiura filiformis]|uniref:uncharacterized protein YqhO-like n=1 Tax=Amphiura filiformis TaxID=82378 RepID=UPI003B214028